VKATVEEFAGVDLGDRRLDRRAEAIVEKLSKKPSAANNQCTGSVPFGAFTSAASSRGVPASTVITDNRLQVLRALCAKNDHQIPKVPTARDIMQAIALLGGHIRQNGEPGWIVLWRGYETVLDAEYAIEAVKEFAKQYALA